MSKIPVDGLISQFQRMYKEHWRYEWGAAETGCVDCSGAFVWAYRQYGQSIAHGSNNIARNYCETLLPIAQARPGMAAFKYHTPGQKGYDLPDKYSNSSDKNDYYHIGLIDETGEYVLNAQSTDAGFTRTKLSKWGAVGYLKAVAYRKGDDDKPMERMIVVADSGSTVRVRKAPSTSSAELTALKVGTIVQADPEDKGWRRIEFDGNREGYMMAKFLAPAPPDMPDVIPNGVATMTDLPLPTPEANSQFVTLTLTREDMEKLYQARDLLIQVLGVG